MTQAMTIRLPDNVYEALRLENFKTRTPMNAIILDALAARLGDIDPERYAQLCALFEAAWHHAVPESLDDLPPMTSEEARALANLAEQVMM